MRIDELVNSLKAAVEAGLLTREEAAAFFKSKLGIHETVVTVDETPADSTPEQPAA